MSNAVFQGYQQPVYQQPTYPTQLPQLQRQNVQMMQQPVMQPQQMPPMAQSVLTLVTSREQAAVAQIPFDGNPYFFYNTAADEMYCKRFDPATGQSPQITYKREQQVQPQEYATISMVQDLAGQLQGLQEVVQAMSTKGGKRTAPQKEDDA